MILIIAEKPSLARNIVSEAGNMKRNDGFYSNNEYLVRHISNENCDKMRREVEFYEFYQELI